MTPQNVMMLNLVIMFFMGFMTWLIFLRNFLLSWLKVKMPWTKYNVLVEISHPIQNYYAPGQISKNFLYFKGRKTPDNKRGGRIVDLTNILATRSLQSISERKLGVQSIIVDDAKSCIYYLDGESYKAISGYSSEAIDDLVYDAQNRPSQEDGAFKPKAFQYMVIGGIVLLGLGIVMVYMSTNKGTALVDGHLKMIYDYTTAIANHLNVTSVVSNFTGIGG